MDTQIGSKSTIEQQGANKQLLAPNTKFFVGIDFFKAKSKMVK